jgi:tight adherence protein B
MNGSFANAIAATVLAAATALVARAALASSRRRSVERRLQHGADAPPSASGSALAAMVQRVEHDVPPPRWLASSLDDAAIDVSVGHAWAAWLGALAITATAGLILAGPAITGLAMVAVTLGPLVALRARRGRGAARVEASLPEALESVARALRSGASLRQAIEEAGNVTPGALGIECRRVAVDASRGVPLTSALEALASRRPLPSVRLAMAALCLGAETGGAQAQAVDGVATTIRDRLGVTAEAKALASQARMSALVIGLAPVAFGVFAASTDPRTSQFLFHSGAGAALLAAGLVLDASGWLWMQRLCRVHP